MQKFIYQVEKGDTLDSIAKKYQVSASDIVLENGADEAYPGQRLLIRKGGGQSYMVAPFENADSVAKKFGMTRAELLKKNGIGVDGDVFLGQIVWV